MSSENSGSFLSAQEAIQESLAFLKEIATGGVDRMYATAAMQGCPVSDEEADLVAATSLFAVTKTIETLHELGLLNKDAHHDLIVRRARARRAHLQ
jgi:hypothetical protein